MPGGTTPGVPPPIGPPPPSGHFCKLPDTVCNASLSPQHCILRRQGAFKGGPASESDPWWAHNAGSPLLRESSQCCVPMSDLSAGLALLGQRMNQCYDPLQISSGAGGHGRSQAQHPRAFVPLPPRQVCHCACHSSIEKHHMLSLHRTLGASQKV